MHCTLVFTFSNCIAQWYFCSVSALHSFNYVKYGHCTVVFTFSNIIALWYFRSVSALHSCIYVK